MPRKVIVKNTWRKLSAPSLSLFLKNIVTKMTDNKAFPTPPFPLTEMLALHVSFSDAYNKKNNGTEAMDVYAAMKIRLLEWTRATADYVTDVAKGDAALIRTTGFEATNQDVKKRGKPEDAKAIHAVSKKGGKIVSSSEKVPNADKYVHLSIINAQYEAQVDAATGQLTIKVGEATILLKVGNKREVLTGTPPRQRADSMVFGINRNGAGGLSPATGVDTQS